MDLRCASKLHGRLDGEKREIEVKCSSRFCGAEPGVVVLHRIHLDSGEVTTSVYREPHHHTHQGKESP